MGECDGETIVVGDWVVAGRIPEDRDVGEIVALDGDMARVQWSASGPTVVDLTSDDVEVYARRRDAMERMASLDGVQS